MEDWALIQYVVFFYEKGKYKIDYIRKEKFRASIERNVSHLKTLKNVIR